MCLSHDLKIRKCLLHIFSSLDQHLEIWGHGSVPENDGLLALGGSWCPKPGSSSILGSCSWEMKRWSRKDEQVVWGDLCDNAGALLDCCGVAEFSRKAKLLIYWSVYVPTPQLWSWALGSDRMDKAAGQGPKEPTYMISMPPRRCVPGEGSWLGPGFAIGITNRTWPPGGAKKCCCLEGGLQTPC